RDEMIDQGRQHYVAEIPAEPETNAAKKYVTRLDIVLNSDPFEPRSAETLRILQAWLHDEIVRTPLVTGTVQAECYGVTANALDLAAVTESDRHRVNALVLAAIFIILLVLVRKLWLAGYLLVTVLFSYF